MPSRKVWVSIMELKKSDILFALTVVCAIGTALSQGILVSVFLVATLIFMFGAFITRKMEG